MNNSEYIEILKSFIKSRITADKVSYSFFLEIKEGLLDQLKLFFPELADFNSQEIDHIYDIAVKEYISINPIDIEPSSSLVKEGFKTWLTEERKESIINNYLNRYLTHLKKSGRSPKVVEEIRSSSEKIMEKLGDPKSDHSFYCKGLVVGSVQSGKTGNFNAVINRALDTGYSLIIVLSGIMEDLRSQTQARIDEDVIGEGIVDILRDKKALKGVGKERQFGELGDQSVAQVFSITSYKTDFKKTIKETDFSLNNKNILVCKKNTGVLKNLLLWLDEYLADNKEKHDIPFLIIDDEADNASLNNLGSKGREYASTINGHIRALLNLFSKKSYLGYTATPFANVLQDRNQVSSGKWEISYKRNGEEVKKEFGQVDNIFPDDFIVLLNSPTNYIGAKQLFETVLDDNIRKIPLVDLITDHLDSFPERVVENNGGGTYPATFFEEKTRAVRKDDPYPLTIPRSLEEAVECFILSIALRLSRNPSMMDSKLLNPHHTMLVHVSRFITWQNRTRDLIKIHLEDMESRIANDNPTSPKSIYSTLEKAWNRNFAFIVENIRSYLPDGYQDEFLVPKSFSQIKHLLNDAVKGIDILALNSETKDKLEYVKDSFGNGRKIIAVGGNRLSRGFTLEGLTINYFLRNTNFSDTLLQMGRWFGYRPGYIDCCKIFTTSEAVEKFDSTTRAIEELEVEFKKMEQKNKTPKDFVIRVRKHPGTLKITRPSILKNTKEIKWSYQDELVQTTKFNIGDSGKLNNVWASFLTQINSYKDDINVNEEFLTVSTDARGIIEFLKLPNAFHDTELNSVIQFIELCRAKNKLLNWTIAIKRKGDGKVLEGTDIGLLADIEMSVRRGPDKTAIPFRTQFVNDGIFCAAGRSANIVSGQDFSILLTPAEKERAVADFRKERQKFYEEKKKYTPELALIEAGKANPPERIYREAMSDQDGLLVVYLLDIEQVFREDKGDEELSELFQEKEHDPNIPLIGIAIGFPPISPDPGGEYVQGDYDIEDEGEEIEEWNSEMDNLNEA